MQQATNHVVHKTFNGTRVREDRYIDLLSRWADPAVLQANLKQDGLSDEVFSKKINDYLRTVHCSAERNYRQYEKKVSVTAKAIMQNLSLVPRDTINVHKAIEYMWPKAAVKPSDPDGFKQFLVEHGEILSTKRPIALYQDGKLIDNDMKQEVKKYIHAVIQRSMIDYAQHALPQVDGFGEGPKRVSKSEEINLDPSQVRDVR